MKEHQGFEALDVIKRVDGAIVEFSLRHLELQWDGLAHDVRRKRWLHIELNIKRMRKSDFEGLYLTAHHINLTSKVNIILINGGKGPLEIG